MTIEKKGATPFENAPHGATAQADITTPVREVEAPRGAYHPLSWRTPEVQDGDQAPQIPDPVVGWHALAAPAKAKMRGKTRRNARRDALAAKRHQAGGATLDALCLAAGIFWLATVLLWAWEVLQ